MSASTSSSSSTPVPQYNKSGLIYCSGQFGSNPFCVTKLIELLISLTLLIIVLYDAIMRYKQQRSIMSVFFALCSLMVLALICNCAYCLDHKMKGFNFMQGFFYNNYFVLIVYYVAYKLIHVMDCKKVYLWMLHTAFIVSIFFLISVLIQKFISIETSCEQLWYLVVSGFTILLSVALTILGAGYTRKQIQKLSGIDNPTHYKNPLPNIWIWISVNIFSQLCSFIQSLIFQLTPDNYCTFSKNFGVDQGVKLLFVFMSFHLGMISTIIFFRNKYRREKENEEIDKISNRKSHGRRASVNIELIEEFSIAH